jgi:hypothetical protein
MVKSYSSASSTYRNFYFSNKTKISIFGGISKFFKLIVFGQIWADLGRFGQLLLHWQWLIAYPNLGWNLKNLITFEPWVQTLCVASHWKATIHIYNLKKFQKIQKIIAFTAACPKSLNSIYGTHWPLEVKISDIICSYVEAINQGCMDFVSLKDYGSIVVREYKIIVLDD